MVLKFICIILYWSSFGVVWADTNLNSAFQKKLHENRIKSAGLFVGKIGKEPLQVELKVGSFSELEAIAVGSASKWITASTIVSLIGDGKFQSTSGVHDFFKTKNKTGEKQFNVEQLLSLQSGLKSRPSCILRPRRSILECAHDIVQNEFEHSPGSHFNYGSSHYQVLGAFVEKLTGESYVEIFNRKIARPLQFSKDTKYYTFPRKKFGDQPFLAGGLVISTVDYLKFLSLVANGGTFQGQKIIDKNLISEMEKDRFRSDIIVANTPYKDSKYKYHYAFGNWVECSGASTTCSDSQIRSSLGAFGFYPWIDRKNGYYAVFATEGSTDTYLKSENIVKALQPLIAAHINAKK